jgi:hypothetical protein
MADIWDPEMELDASEAPVLDIKRVYRGTDEARHFWQQWFSAWETVQYDYELLDAGERVVMLLDLKMGGAPRGSRCVWEVRLGQYVQGRADHPHEALHESVERPRSRRAVGVGQGSFRPRKS